MELRSFKLRLADAHVRIVPATDDAGCPFAGPGVDLRGASAAEAFRVAGPLLAALAEIEPGIVVRSLSVDLGARGAPRRILAALDPPGTEAAVGPRVLRLDEEPAMERVWRELPTLVAFLTMSTRSVLARRA